jgi:signal peptidase I
MNRRRWLWLLVVVVGIVAVTPSCIRAYRVEGASDAPSFLVGDRILVSKAAYDVRLPYTDIVILSHSDPRAGDVVLYRPPGEKILVFKRVVGGPGDVLVMRDSHLEVNGRALEYEAEEDVDYGPVSNRNNLGTVIEWEIGNGPPHLVTHTPGEGLYAAFEAVHIPEEQYFVLGDNRDSSLDSRMYGPIAREAILGKVVHTFR